MKAVKISALLPEIEEGIKKIEHETARTKQHAKQQKQVFSAELDKCDIYLAQNKPETLGLVASILNQLSKARGKIPPDQELYNLDARYRTMVSRINSAGAKR